MESQALVRPRRKWEVLLAAAVDGGPSSQRGGAMPPSREAVALMEDGWKPFAATDRYLFLMRRKPADA
jgi:hypothetical protein